MAAADLAITDVIAHPLSCRLPKPQRTGFGDYPVIEIVLVEIRTDAGVFAGRDHRITITATRVS